MRLFHSWRTRFNTCILVRSFRWSIFCAPCMDTFESPVYIYPKICRAKRSTFEARYNTSVRLTIVETWTTKTAPRAHILIEDLLLLERYTVPLGKLFLTFRRDCSVFIFRIQHPKKTSNSPFTADPEDEDMVLRNDGNRFPVNTA